MHDMTHISAAVRGLNARDIDVLSIDLRHAVPRLQVCMPAAARPLPGTTYKRTRCDIGMREQRTAHAYGCDIDWEIKQ